MNGLVNLEGSGEGVKISSHLLSFHLSCFSSQVPSSPSSESHTIFHLRSILSRLVFSILIYVNCKEERHVKQHGVLC